MERSFARAFDAIRPVKMVPDFTRNCLASTLISTGNTMILCTASVEERVPQFLLGTGRGWITAEYSLLPGSTHPRSQRSATRGRLDGRSVEIQRLIGRSLRSCVNLKKLGERTIWIDCDVLQADGGTRVASITGGYVSLRHAIDKLIARKTLKKSPILSQIAAISVGIVKGKVLLDLDYAEDSQADVDMNFVMNDQGDIVEIQGTAESKPFNEKQLQTMTALATSGIQKLFHYQNEINTNTRGPSQ